MMLGMFLNPLKSALGKLVDENQGHYDFTLDTVNALAAKYEVPFKVVQWGFGLRLVRV